MADFRQLCIAGFCFSSTLASWCAGQAPGNPFQQQRLFDPKVLIKCERELGHGIGDNSAPAARTFEMECGDLASAREKIAFASLRSSMVKADKQQRDAYSNLTSTFTVYRRIFLKLEEKGCGGGVGCSSEANTEAAHVDYEFLMAAEGLDKKELSGYSALDATRADTLLNVTYRQVLNGHPVACPAPGSNDYDNYCVSRTEIRATQRAWIAYRDAFVAFAALRWPEVSRDSWLGYLETERTKDGW